MLTDFALRNLKPRATLYKVADRDGMYVAISPTGSISFRYDYGINGRRETLTLGRYGFGGISLAAARDKLSAAKRLVRDGISPGIQKQREKARGPELKTFGDHAANWLYGATMAPTTRAMRKSVLDRDILPIFKKRLLSEVQAEDLRALCLRVKGRGAPTVALNIREIIKLIYGYAHLHGEKVSNPADDVNAASIATCAPKDRALSPDEIQLMCRQLELAPTHPAIRLALRLILLTLVRKSELIEATWDEVDFEAAVCTIPKARMKGRRAHNVYLSSQALDIMIALRTYSAGSRYVLPSRYSADRCMSKATLNRVTQLVSAQAKAAGVPLESFTVHDLRRTGSTLLNEAGFNGDWVEKCLAHESGRSSRSIYNKAEYAEPRRHMLQEWARIWLILGELERGMRRWCIHWRLLWEVTVLDDSVLSGVFALQRLLTRGAAKRTPAACQKRLFSSDAGSGCQQRLSGVLRSQGFRDSTCVRHRSLSHHPYCRFRPNSDLARGCFQQPISSTSRRFSYMKSR